MRIVIICHTALKLRHLTYFITLIMIFYQARHFVMSKQVRSRTFKFMFVTLLFLDTEFGTSFGKSQTKLFLCKPIKLNACRNLTCRNCFCFSFFNFYSELREAVFGLCLHYVQVWHFFFWLKMFIRFYLILWNFNIPLEA